MFLERWETAEEQERLKMMVAGMQQERVAEGYERIERMVERPPRVHGDGEGTW